MPRQLRVQTPGIHHITSRGNDKQVIFDDTLRGGFLGHLAHVASAFDWGVLGWVLMTNHFHLVVEVGDLGLARGMHRLNLGLALAANARFGRINHNSGDRYWNKPLEDERAVHECIRYVMWNPVRAGVADDPWQSRWTSCRASAGLERPHPALALNRLLAIVGSVAAFAALVDSGRELR